MSLYVCVLYLFHSTMEEWLVQMVEFKFINQSINETCIDKALMHYFYWLAKELFMQIGKYVS